MNDSSKEWIKYLTLPIWCNESEDYYYTFPTLKKEFFITEHVYQAFHILIYQNDITYYKDAQNQENKIKIINNYIKMKKQCKDLKKSNDDKDKKIKDQDKKIEDQDKKIEDQQKQIDELQAKLYGKHSGAGHKGNKNPFQYRKNKLNNSTSS